MRAPKNPRKPHWIDYNLAHAVETLLAEHCPKCGVPTWWAYSEDSAVDFKENEHTCYACQFADTAGKERKARPGVEHTVVPIPAEGFEKLPSRKDFYEGLVAAEERRAKNRAAAQAAEQE